MAGKDDQAKKRKRATAEAVGRAKRHRTEKTSQNKSSRRNSSGPTNGSAKAAVPRQEDGPRELELNREFDNGEAGWRVSKPIGGRMLDIDPILTEDEQHLIIAYHTSIQVYSATDSLLVRRIPISTLSSSENLASTQADFIVAMKCSIQDPDFLWVVTNSGRVLHVNWTRTSSAPKGFQTSSKKVHDLVVARSAPAASDEALLVLETDDNGYANLNIYPGSTSGDVEPVNILSMKAPDAGLNFLSANTDGQVVCGALGDRLFIASWKKLDKEHCETFSFKVPDLIASLDMRVDERSGKQSKNKQSYPGSDLVVDLVVGGARGAIYRYSDLLTGLHCPEKANAAKKDLLQAQKYHWHRRAVHAVKWSRDGNYLISGGSEDTLVIWQLDTGLKNFLPHLSGVVENVVVSSRGSSYIVHLDDNSTMVLSTAELKPTAYVSGIKSATTYVRQPKDLLVKGNGPRQIL